MGQKTDTGSAAAADAVLVGRTRTRHIVKRFTADTRENLRFMFGAQCLISSAH